MIPFGTFFREGRQRPAGAGLQWATGRSERTKRGPAAMLKKVPNPIDRHVGSRVRMRRMLAGVSQERLGEALGLTFQQVQKYEKGTNRISASRLQQIAKMLGVPVAFFFDGLCRRFPRHQRGRAADQGFRAHQEPARAPAHRRSRRIARRDADRDHRAVTSSRARAAFPQVDRTPFRTSRLGGAPPASIAAQELCMDAGVLSWPGSSAGTVPRPASGRGCSG